MRKKPACLARLAAKRAVRRVLLEPKGVGGEAKSRV